MRMEQSMGADARVSNLDHTRCSSSDGLITSKMRSSRTTYQHENMDQTKTKTQTTEPKENSFLFLVCFMWPQPQTYISQASTVAHLCAHRSG